MSTFQAVVTFVFVVFVVTAVGLGLSWSGES